MENLLLDTDSYKASHPAQLPPDMDGALHYLEARTGGRYDRTVFFGLQYILARYLSRPVTYPDVSEAAEFFKAHGEPFPTDGWLRVVDKHHGRLPIRIRAVPEGSVVPSGNALLTVESIDPALPWLPGWLETMLMRVWYPTTVATRSWHARRLILDYLRRTDDDPDSKIDFALHDFGSRGTSSRESAAIGGAAHLVNFKGSDTVIGVRCASEFYDCPMPAFSVPAAEHSTILAWGRDGEEAAYKHILAQFAKPGGIVSVVSDTYDVDVAIRDLWGGSLRQRVIDSGALLVVRLDSGDPATGVVAALRRLSEAFGATANAKGYRVLKHVKVLQGDGLSDEAAIESILSAVERDGYSTGNIATLGMGGGLLQKLDRDTCRFAYKPCAVRRAGVWHPVRKVVASDPSKASKAGRLDLVRDTAGAWATVDRDAQVGERHMLLQLHGSGLPSALETVYENGEMLLRHRLDDVRTRARDGEAATGRV